MYKSLGLFQKKGPVIVRPGLNLCQALLDTEIRLPTSEFRMPYPIMGIELPEAIVKPHWPSLTIVWKMFPDTVLVWTMSPNTICYHNLLGDDLPTMEDRLIRAEACDDETEYNLMVLGSRIALNLCMLATFRLTDLTPLCPPGSRGTAEYETSGSTGWRPGIARKSCSRISSFVITLIKSTSQGPATAWPRSTAAGTGNGWHTARSSRNGSGRGSTTTGRTGMKSNPARNHRPSSCNSKQSR